MAMLLFRTILYLLRQRFGSHVYVSRKQCGVTASDAMDVCEACPGGSRLECSDPTHNCFAGITDCPTSSSTPASSNPSPPSQTPPSPSVQTTTVPPLSQLAPTLVGVATSTPPTTFWQAITSPGFATEQQKFCAMNAVDAKNRCATAVACFDGQDNACPDNEMCFPIPEPCDASQTGDPFNPQPQPNNQPASPPSSLDPPAPSSEAAGLNGTDPPVETPTTPRPTWLFEADQYEPPPSAGTRDFTLMGWFLGLGLLFY